ncbi:hypothetical protein [Oceanobacillus halophilus]|uniref:Uncharacterized protein n=1 Tax=Oceanobacillus halophilus TaxID=930130 RepID=A0A495A1D6_9BACI|nr:hypothetical protein [Oceanobacillus halophilus]RKQ33280.1 hypothetical protein D8M06_10945 [Oceanobacillus halophilus]
MSLNNVRLQKVVKKQSVYKVKANLSMYSSLIVIQLLALLFSLGGTGTMGTSSVGYNGITIRLFSADIVIVFTMIWGFITAIMLTTKAYKEDEFIFVTNRLTSNLSNIIFLFVASIFSGITAVLSGYLLKVIMFSFFNYEFLHAGTSSEFGIFISGLLTTILYVFMFSSFGYLIGTVVQLSKMFIIIVPVVIIGGVYLLSRINQDVILDIGSFYFLESNFFIALTKIILTAGICFLAAIFISNRLEVRK